MKRNNLRNTGRRGKYDASLYVRNQGRTVRKLSTREIAEFQAGMQKIIEARK